MSMLASDTGTVAISQMIVSTLVPVDHSHRDIGC